MQPHDEELLSAFHDGELHGDDRQAVERLLAESAAAREAVEEFAEIRTALHALPRTSAPADLQSTVMRQLRTSQPVVAPPPPPPRRRHPSLRWIVSAAACLTIVVGVYSLSQFVDPARHAAVEGVARTDAPAPGMPPPESYSEAVGLDTATPAPPRGAAPDAALAMNAPQFDVVDLERLQSLIADGELPAPGELIQDLHQIDDQLVLIEYSVVDVQRMLGQVEVILEEHGIRRITQSGEIGEPVAGSPGEMYGIYVDAPSEQYVKAVAELELLDGIVAVSTAAPAEDAASRLNQSRLQAETAAADSAADLPEAPPSSARNTRRDELPPAAAEVQAADAAPPEPPAPLPADPAAMSGSRPAQSLQYRVPLHSDLFSEPQEEHAPADQDAQQRQALDPAQRDRSRDPAAAPPDTDAASPDRVRVVIVFVPSSDQ